MRGSGIDLNSVKIHQIVFGGLLFFAAILAVRAMVFGASTNVSFLAVGTIAIAIILAVDKYYWIFCPLLTFLPVSIPGLPFNSGELGRLFFLSMFFLRSALQRESGRGFVREVLFAAPYFVWVLLIFCFNPSGFAIFGSETIGGRFYFQIALGFFTLLFFSKLRISEKDAKIWFYGLIVALFVQFLISLTGFMEVDSGESKVRYFLTTAAPLLLLLLSRYSLSQMVSLSWRFFVASFLAGAVVYSGKRTSVGQVFLAPFLLTFMRRKERMLLMALGICGAFFLTVLVMGHGHLYELPFSVQRSLSFLPGEWDSSLENYGFKDLFREDMHRRAKEVIKENPWFGHRGYTIDRSEIVWINSEARGDNSYSGHEVVGNWHNKGYGMAADFGIPATLFWYFFSISAVCYVIKVRSKIPCSGYKWTLFLYYSLYLFYDLVFAFGHSALTPLLRWTDFAFVLVLSKGTDEVQIRRT